MSTMSTTPEATKEPSSEDRANGVTQQKTTDNDVKNTMMNHPETTAASGGARLALNLEPRVGNSHLAPSSPPHRNRVYPTASSPPITHPRLRSSSFGQHHQHPLGYLPPPSSPYAPRSVPVSPVTAAKQSLTTTLPLRMPFLPAENTEQRKAMEAAVAKERKRAKEMELQEAGMSADELRAVLKRERHRMGRIAADLAVLKCNTVHAQLEAEMVEEGHINTLLRRMDELQQEKGRIIVELEREEEMVRFALCYCSVGNPMHFSFSLYLFFYTSSQLTNTLQKQLEEVRRDKAKLEQQIEHEKQVHASLESQLMGMQGKQLPIKESLEEEEEMEEE